MVSTEHFMKTTSKTDCITTVLHSSGLAVVQSVASIIIRGIRNSYQLTQFMMRLAPLIWLFYDKVLSLPTCTRTHNINIHNEQPTALLVSVYILFSSFKIRVLTLQCYSVFIAR